MAQMASINAKLEEIPIVEESLQEILAEVSSFDLVRADWWLMLLFAFDFDPQKQCLVAFMFDIFVISCGTF